MCAYGDKSGFHHMDGTRTHTSDARSSDRHPRTRRDESVRLLLTRSGAKSHKAAVRASGLELFSGFSSVLCSEFSLFSELTLFSKFSSESRSPVISRSQCLLVLQSLLVCQLLAFKSYFLVIRVLHHSSKPPSLSVASSQSLSFPPLTLSVSALTYAPSLMRLLVLACSTLPEWPHQQHSKRDLS